jgi:hypothetical protein
MELEVSRLYPFEPATLPYPETDKFNPNFHHLYPL